MAADEAAKQEESAAQPTGVSETKVEETEVVPLENQDSKPPSNNLEATSVRDRSISTPVKDSKDGNIKEDRERSKSSPKTLQELSKEISNVIAENSTPRPDENANEDVDEGVDMHGNIFCLIIVFIAFVNNNKVFVVYENHT